MKKNKNVNSITPIINHIIQICVLHYVYSFPLDYVAVLRFTREKCLLYVYRKLENCWFVVQYAKLTSALSNISIDVLIVIIMCHQVMKYCNKTKTEFPYAKLSQEMVNVFLSLFFYMYFSLRKRYSYRLNRSTALKIKIRHFLMETQITIEQRHLKCTYILIKI